MSSIFIQEGFCFIYTTQVGVVMLSCMGLTLVSISLMINVTADDPKLEFMPTLKRWMVFCSFMFLCILCYTEGLISVLFDLDPDFNRRHANVAAIFQALVVIFWLGLVISSYIVEPKDMDYICMNHRCADRIFIEESAASIREQSDSSVKANKSEPDGDVNAVARGNRLISTTNPRAGRQLNVSNSYDSSEPSMFNCTLEWTPSSANPEPLASTQLTTASPESNASKTAYSTPKFDQVSKKYGGQSQPADESHVTPRTVLRCYIGLSYWVTSILLSFFVFR